MFSIITAKVRRELRSTGHELLFQLALRWIQREEIGICMGTSWMTYNSQVCLLLPVAVQQILRPMIQILLQRNLPCLWICPILLRNHMT